MNTRDELPPAGRWGRFQVFEPLVPTNLPLGSENWPVVEMRIENKVTMTDPVGPDEPLDPTVAEYAQKLAERVAGVPDDERSALLQRIGREIERRVSDLSASPGR